MPALSTQRGAAPANGIYQHIHGVYMQRIQSCQLGYVPTGGRCVVGCVRVWIQRVRALLRRGALDENPARRLRATRTPHDATHTRGPATLPNKRVRLHMSPGYFANGGKTARARTIKATHGAWWPRGHARLAPLG